MLLCLAAGGPGLADRLSAWTGIHGSGVGEDTSEYLLSTAPDFRRAVESLRPAHLPLPPGYTWRRARVFQAVDRREPTSISATAIKDIHAMYAACTWEAEWLAGRRAGDTGRVRTATRVLAEARSWPDAGADKTGGARRARAEIAKAAANGDPGPLRVDADEAVAVRDAQKRLAPDDRELLTLVAWEGLRADEAAAVLGIGAAAARQRLVRARRRL